MKNTLKFLSLIIGIAAVSCAKNEAAPEPAPQESPKMTVLMTTEGETKTAMTAPTGDSKTYTTKWTKGDQLGVFVRSFGNDVNNNVATTALEANTTTATFSVEVESPLVEETYEFYTYYPYSSIEGQSYKAVKVEIPAEQSPANDSFDPKADILSGYPVEKTVEAEQSELSGLKLQFIRKSSVVRLLVPSCKDFDGISGESYVTEVKVTFDKNVVGTATWDITDKADLTLDESSASNTVVVRYDANTHKVTDPIWLSIAPVTGVSSISFAFKVADNAYLQATASLSTPVSFAAGGVKKFSVPISATSWELKSFGIKYEKVTSEPSDWRGEYLIVGENESTLYACDQEGTGSWGTCTEVTAAADGSITGTETINGYAFTVVSGTADGTYAFVFHDGGYVSSGAAKKFNKEDSADTDKTDFILTPDGDFVEVKSNTVSERTLMYNYNNGSGGLRFYDNGTSEGVRLYKKVEDYSVIVPVIADPVGIPDAISRDGVIDAEFTCGITNLGKNSVSVKSLDGTVVTAASVAYADGTATVTYTVAANTDADRHGSITLKAGDTEKTIDLYQETGVVLPEISDVDDQNITYEASTERNFDVTITNVGTNEVTCTFDGTVVTAASAALKSGDVYTVTYTVTENTGMESRSGKITINCSTISKDVNIIQDYNQGAVKTYKRVASLSDIEEGEYVIVASTSTITAYLPNDFNTSSAPSAVTTGFTCNDSEFKTLATNAGWTFSGTTSEMTIKSTADAKNYLYNISNNNGTRVGTTSDKWEIKTHSSAGSLTNIFEFKDANNSRYTGIYNNANWRSYDSATATNYETKEGSSKIKLYLLDDGKTKPIITTTDKSITTLGSQDVSEMFSSNSDGEKSYTVSGGTLEGTIFSANEAGTYTVTLTQAASDTYRAAKATATVTVTTAPSLAAAEITATGDNANKQITVTWTDVENATGYVLHCNSDEYEVTTGLETYTITGLSYATEYDIYLTANATGYYSSDSEHKSVTLDDPAQQSLEKPEITAVEVSGTTVTVQWNSVANAESYYVECGSLNQTVTSTSAEFTCTAGQYDVKVTAKADGYNDGVSEIKQVEVYETLATPTELTTSDITSSSIKLTWDAVEHADEGYQVAYTTDSATPSTWTDVTAGTTSYTFNGLSASTGYTLYVKAQASGYYTESAASSVNATTTGAIKSITTYTDGSYLLVDYDSNAQKYFALKGGVSNKVLAAVDITSAVTKNSDGTITVDTQNEVVDISTMKYTLSENGTVIKNGDQKIVQSTSANDLVTSGENTWNYVTKDNVFSFQSSFTKKNKTSTTTTTNTALLIMVTSWDGSAQVSKLTVKGYAQSNMGVYTAKSGCYASGYYYLFPVK